MLYYWNATYQVTFEKLKSLVCENTTLRYFNLKKPNTMEVNTPSKALGATFIQHDGPIAFALKTVKPT